MLIEGHELNKDINFEGNEIFKQAKLKSKLKNTKSKNQFVFGRDQNI